MRTYIAPFCVLFLFLQSCKQENGGLFEAVKKNDLTEVTRSVEQRHADVSFRYQHGITALHLAASMGYVDVAKYLIDHGAKVDDVEQLLGAQPIHLASERGHLDMVRLLVTRGASVDAETPNGWRIIHATARSGDVNLINFLVSAGAAVNAPDHDGTTPLHVAAYFNQDAALTCLLNAGADFSLKDRQGQTALDVARQRGSQKIIAILEAMGSVGGNRAIRASSVDGELQKH